MSDTGRRIAGTITFDTSVTFEKLRTLTAVLKARYPNQWIDLHIRRAGINTHHIGFHYHLYCEDEQSCTNMINSLIQFFREQLGIRVKPGKRPVSVPVGVMEWDISIVRDIF